MEVDGPVAILADSIADLLAHLERLVDHLAVVIALAAVGSVGAVKAEGAVTELDTGSRGLAKASRTREPGRVALDVISREPAQQLIGRYAKSLALDIKQCEIESPEGVNLFAPGWVEILAIHQLPEVLNARWILADDNSGELLYRVPMAALADPRDPLVGLDRHDMARLVEDRTRTLAAHVVVAHPRDFHPREGCFEAGGGQAERKRSECGFDGSRHLAYTLYFCTISGSGAIRDRKLETLRKALPGLAGEWAGTRLRRPAISAREGLWSLHLGNCLAPDN